MHSDHIGLDIFLHQKEPQHSVSSEHCSEDFMLALNLVRVLEMKMEINMEISLQDHKSHSIKLLMQYEVTDSIMFTMATPDSFMSVTCAQRGPAVI